MPGALEDRWAVKREREAQGEWRERQEAYGGLRVLEERG